MNGTRTILMAAVLAALLLPLPAAAVSPPAAGLTVSLYDAGDVLAAQTTTDEEGIFTLSDLAAGAYTLVAEDAALTMSLQFAVEITADQEPAGLTGQVWTWQETDVAAKIVARVISGADIAALDIERVSLSPRKWNLNYRKSNGKIKVVLHGTGLEAVTAVTLSSSEGSLSTTTLTFDPEEGTAKAAFVKSAVVTELVPDGTAARTTLDVDITVEAPGFSQTWTKQVYILGK